MIQAVRDLIACTRLDLSDEKRAQAMLAEAFEAAGIPAEREVRLAPGDIVDFLIGSLAVEVKLRGTAKKEIFKQLTRYARHERVEAVMLASNISMGLPPEIEGKPAYFVSLWRAWL